MEKEILIKESKFEKLSAVDTWEELYNKELNCKKHILEYIETINILKREDVSAEKIEETYHYIYESIEGIKDTVKPNTIMHLKNVLRTQLGRFVKEKDSNQKNHFIEFFKLAYPVKKRRKDFTRVLMDLDTISADQLWTTLTYINREYTYRDLKLSAKQKKDVAEVIEKSVNKNNAKFNIKLMSLKQLLNHLKVSIEKDGKEFKVVSYKGRTW